MVFIRYDEDIKGYRAHDEVDESINILRDDIFSARDVLEWG